MSVDTAPTVAACSPSRRLRALRRGGVGAHHADLRALLREDLDPLVRESAGSLIGGAATTLADTGAFAATSIALLASSTVDSLPHLLRAALVRDGVLPEVGLAGFNQWRMEILSGAPTLRELAPRVVALLLDDTVVFDEVPDPLDLDAVAARCAALPGELAQWADAARATLGGLVVLCTVPLGPLRRGRLVDLASRSRLAAAWHRMNADLLALGTQPGTVVLDADAVTARAGATAAPDRMRHVAGQTLDLAFLAAYADELATVAKADLGRAAKCLVLDLDNTLWGGVVGDDGVDALALGGAYPGSAHAELQSVAHDLMRQGVLLAVASKNDDAVARGAMSGHPEMLLRPECFVASRIDWHPKPDAVRAMARELNIGSDAMVFLDDNPVERGLMRDLAPEVATVEVPPDPAGLAAALTALDPFVTLALTDDDRRRTDMYRAGTQRADLQRSSTSLAEYLTGLGSALRVEPLGAANRARIAQLFAKTNQFNLTTRRFGTEDIAQRVRTGAATFFGVRLADRFGDNGLVGAIALGRDDDGAWRVLNFVLSCRVFSRDAEHAVVGLVLRGARADGAPAVRATYARSAKNKMFADFYDGLGFACADPVDAPRREFSHDLVTLPDLPAWISVVDATDPSDGGPFHAPR